MNKRIFAISFCMLLSVAGARALTITQITPDPGIYLEYVNSGQYLGTVLGENTDMGTVQTALDELGMSIDLVTSGKYEGDDGTTEGDFNVDVSFSDLDGGMSGTWSVEDNPLEFPVSLYTVKGGAAFALYLVEPAALSGTWNVGNLPRNENYIPRGFSHFVGYSTVPVPEPASLLLLGTGLLGAAFFRKKA